MSRTHKTVAISLRPELQADALARAKELGFQNSFSAYVAKLIADDLASQQPAVLRDAPITVERVADQVLADAVAQAHTEESPVSYKAKKPRRKPQST